jgi:hypothetical protein
MYLTAPGVLLQDMAARVTMPDTFSLAPAASSGGGAEWRSDLFDAFATRLAELFGGLFDMPAQQAWAEANEIVEGAGIDWVFRRDEGETVYTMCGSC